MISEFIQKALLKNEKSASVLIKNEKLKIDVLSGIEISDRILNEVFNKETLKRKDFTRLEEVIKADLDNKVSAIEDSVLLYDLISDDFKRFDKATIKNRLLKKEYLYITGKTLYEHLINRKENSLEQIRQNRLLLFLDIEYKDWNMIENLVFEKYYRIPSMLYFAVFSKNAENTINYSMLIFNDTFERIEYSCIDKNYQVKLKYSGKGSETIDFYKFDLEEEKHHTPIILFVPKLQENILRGNIILFDSQRPGFVQQESLFIKAIDSNNIIDELNNEENRNMAGIWLSSLKPFLLGTNHDILKKHSKTAIINTISGQYKCFTIGKQKDRIRSQKLVINKDSSVLFSSSSLHLDTGYAVISDSDKILQIYFHFEEGEFKYNLLIHLDNSDIKSGKLQGVVCGINRLNEPFAERIYLLKCDNESFEPEDYKIGTDNIYELFEKSPELLSVFLGKKNDFSTDFEFLLSFYQNFYLPKQQNIKRICGVFEVFNYDTLRESIRKSAMQIKPNGDILIRYFEKGQSYSGKAEIFEPDTLVVKIFRNSSNINLHGLLISLLDGFEIEGIQNFIAFFTGKNEKNEMVSLKQVCIKTDLSFDSIETAIIPVTSSQFVDLNNSYPGIGNFLAGKTNNVLKTDLTVNHSFKTETDFGQLYFESACFAATHQDKTRAINQLQNAILHGFRNKETLIKELESGNLQLIAADIEIDKLFK
jgi:hypothetical protein